MNQTKILVIDNATQFRTSLASGVLEPALYKVFQVASPEEARKILEKELVHLALVDIRLRNDNDENDQSGLDLCRDMDPMIARIILTGYPGWRLVRDAALQPTKNRRRLADGFIHKQDEGPETILSEVKRVLREEFEIIPKQRYGVLTSGGDSPGMNAAIWAITRIAMDNDTEVIGIRDGYKGLTNDLMHRLNWNEVSDIMAQGGTILGTARYPDFEKQEIRQKAVDNIVRKHISGLIVIGGDGSMKGANALVEDLAKQVKQLRTVAIPGSIDNDLWGTDMSLGADSAANAMIEEMRNMIRPAQALRRIFVCEVMGRYCGYLALQAALGIGADAVIIPEEIVKVDPRYDPAKPEPWGKHLNVNDTDDQLRKQLRETAKLLEGAFASSKRHGFVILAEGIRLLTRPNMQDPQQYMEQVVRPYLEDELKRWKIPDRPDVRSHVLGYPVRGVPPSSFDVWLGAKLGMAAVQCLLDGKTNVMVGWSEERGIMQTPFAEVLEKSKRSPNAKWLDRPKWRELLELQQALACPPAWRH